MSDEVIMVTRNGCYFRVFALCGALLAFILALSPVLGDCLAAEGDEAVQKRLEALLEQKASVEKAVNEIKTFLSQEAAGQAGLLAAIEGLDRLPLEMAGTSDMERLTSILGGAFDGDRVAGNLGSLRQGAMKLASGGLSGSVAEHANDALTKADRTGKLVEDLKALAKATPQELRERIAKERKGLLEAIQDNKEQLDFILLQSKITYVKDAAEPVSRALKEVQQARTMLVQRVQDALRSMQEETGSIQREVEYLRHNNPPKEKKGERQ